MTDLHEFVRDEQLYLWGDLGDAIGSAVNGAWSMQAGSVARRIVQAARLVGPTPHGELPWSLVAGGVYEAVLRAGDLSPDLPDEQEWRRLDELMAECGTRAKMRPMFAPTVAAISADRPWIAGEDEDSDVT